tara:strand:+ start:5287 stop:5472 length:186 start_codon:yes stop_codon:yes gene_type:complete
MIKVLKSIKHIFVNKNRFNKKTLEAVLKLERDAYELNIKSQKYIKSAMKASKDWSDKWQKY